MSAQKQTDQPVPKTDRDSPPQSAYDVVDGIGDDICLLDGALKALMQAYAEKGNGNVLPILTLLHEPVTRLMDAVEVLEDYQYFPQAVPIASPPKKAPQKAKVKKPTKRNKAA